MADVMRKKSMNGVIAHLDGLQDYLTGLTEEKAAISRGILAEHAESGKSKIVTERDENGIDHYIILDDENDALAAMRILKGRKLPGGGRSAPVPVFEHILPGSSNYDR